MSLLSEYISHADLFARIQTELERARTVLPEHWSRVALATARGDIPSLRYVLLKDFDLRGFVFYTHHASKKGRELAKNPRATLAFHWFETGCQIRANGTVHPIQGVESDAYFAQRTRLKQLGAWASRQSRPPITPLEQRLETHETYFANASIPRPDHWGGYRLRPDTVEIWYDGDGRLHERTKYDRQPNGWKSIRLDP